MKKKNNNDIKNIAILTLTCVAIAATPSVCEWCCRLLNKKEVK